MISQIIWWTGAAVWFVAAIYGLSEAGMWVLDRLLKRIGLWPDIYEVMRRYYRERREATEGKPAE